MAFTTPTTRTTGELVTASIWNTDLVEDIKFLANPPIVKVNNSANQSIANASETVLTYNTEQFDTDTMHDTVTNTGRLTAKTAGKYFVVLQVTWAGNATGRRYMSIRKNGVGTEIAKLNTDIDSAATHAQNVSLLVQLAVNDFVDSTAFQDSGAALNVTGGLSETWFAATWVSL